MTDVRGQPLSDDKRRTTGPRRQATPSEAIHVDWIDPSLLRGGQPGRLGMTHLPGKHGISSRYPGLQYGRDLDSDLATLRAVGVGYLLLLVEEHELQRWGDPGIVERAAPAGIVVRRHPIRDGGVAGAPEEVSALLDELRAARDHNDAVIACMGGVGRTGLIAACALVNGGLGPHEAISVVRRLRHPDAVETEVQQRFVQAYARWIRRPQPASDG